jgi:hypothetical protein
MLLTIVSINIFRPKPLPLRAYALTAVLAVSALMGVIAVRTIAARNAWMASDNPDYLGDIAAGASTSLSDTHAAGELGGIDRSLMDPLFLSDLIDQVSNGHPFLHGTLLLDSAYALVPRAIWPDKPVVPSMQLLLRDQFDLPVFDSPASPLIEFYANWGWAGVGVGFLLVGALVRWLTNTTMRVNSPELWILLSWMWAMILDVDNELIFSLLNAMRFVVIFAVGFWVLQQLVKSRIPANARVK